MPLSTREQDEVQTLIECSSPEELLGIKSNAEDTLQQINILMGQKILSHEENKEAQIAIETLLRIESTQQNKGWWFRTKRRLQLTQMYLGG